MDLKKKSEIVKTVSGKEIWKNSDTNRIEEKFMSPHIVKCIDEISDITGYDLEVTNTELFVGDFRADIICKDNNTGDIIVIENQLEQSDHDHLGKGFTYMSNLDAKGIIWICENVRPEHLKAVEKLNEITSDEYNFYLLELKFEEYTDGNKSYFFNKVFIPSSINKLANQVKNCSSDQLENISFFDKIDKALRPVIPINKYGGQGYTYIYNKSNIYGLIKRFSRTNEIQFEFGTIDEESKKKLSSIKDVLNSTYSYNFVYEIGKKNKNLDKYVYLLKNDNDIDKYKDICINMYRTIINNI